MVGSEVMGMLIGMLAYGLIQQMGKVGSGESFTNGASQESFFVGSNVCPNIYSTEQGTLCLPGLCPPISGPFTVQSNSREDHCKYTTLEKCQGWGCTFTLITVIQGVVEYPYSGNHCNRSIVCRNYLSVQVIIYTDNSLHINIGLKSSQQTMVFTLNLEKQTAQTQVIYKDDGFSLKSGLTKSYLHIQIL